MSARRTWSTSGHTCNNCGQVLSRHIDQTFCPEDPMTTPTIPVTPATDEEVGRWRELAPPLFTSFFTWEVVAGLIARIDALKAERDAERAAREIAEADLKEQGDRCTERWEAEHKRANAAEAETAAMFKAWGGCKGECTRSTRERDEWAARAEKAEATLRDLEARATLVVFSDPVGGMSTTKLDPALVLAFDKLKAQNARMREVLTDRNVYRERDGICCVCRGDCVGEVEYHAPDCIVAELLREK